MTRFRWLVVDESSGRVLDEEKIETCEECPNADHTDMVCRRTGGGALQQHYVIPANCPIGLTPARRLS